MHEKRLSLSAYISDSDNRSKTLQMRLHHVFFELDTFVRDLRANGRLAGPRTEKYYLSIADSLDKEIEQIKQGMNKINYIDP